MDTPESSKFSVEAYTDVVTSLEAHYRQLFNESYAVACSYAHILVTLHDLKGKLREGHAQRNEVAELERWFNTER